MEQNKIDLFEVFKIGSTERKSLESIPFLQLQKKFTEITAITTEEQLRQAKALATLPTPGHVVVDQAKFREMFLKESSNAATQKSSELLKRAEHSIENLKTDFSTEMQNIIGITEQSIKDESHTTKAAIRQLLTGLNNFDKAIIDQIDNIVDQQTSNVLSTISTKMVHQNNDKTDST